MHRLRLLLFACVLLTLGCGKNTPAPPRTALLPTEFKQFAHFQVGTHWVYQDSASGQLDSIWVSKTDSVMVELLNDDGDVSDYIEVATSDMLSSRGGYGIRYMLSSGGGTEGLASIPYGHSTLYRILLLTPSPSGGDEADQQSVLGYPLPLDRVQELGFSGSVGTFLRLSTPQRVGGRQYADVIRATIRPDASEQQATVTYFWAKGYGVVGRRLRRPNGTRQTWWLLRQRIVQ